jgi:hypothetical protein
MTSIARGQLTVSTVNDAIISGTAPSSPAVGALWIDTSTNPNVMKTWNGSSWVSQTLALSNLDPGSAAAITTAQNAAQNAQTSANGKNKVYRQSTQPTGTLVAGDTWFDTANGNRVSIYDGSTWNVSQLGTQAIGNIDAGAITTGTLTAIDIMASSTDSNNQVHGTYFDGSTFSFMKFNPGVSNPNLANPNSSDLQEVSKIFVDGFTYATSSMAYGLGSSGLFYSGTQEWQIGSADNGDLEITSTANIDLTAGGTGIITLLSSGVTVLSDVDMSNYNLVNVNTVKINDPGPGEGIQWIGGNGWMLSETTSSMANGAGSMIFSLSTNPSDIRAEINTSGELKMYNSTGKLAGKFTGASIEMLDTTGTFVNLYLKTQSNSGEVRTQSASGAYVNTRTNWVYADAVDVNAGSNMYIRAASGYNVKATVTGTTSSYVPVLASAFTVSSKEEWKTNIQKLNSALSIVKQGEIHTYDWKADHEYYREGKISKIQKRYGFVIGDGYNTPDQLIGTDDEGIDLYSMNSLLWRAVQELSDTVDQLVKKINRR